MTDTELREAAIQLGSAEVNLSALDPDNLWRSAASAIHLALNRRNTDSMRDKVLSSSDIG